MNYRAIGLMSGSSLDGVDIVYATLESKGQFWNYEIHAAKCVPYTVAWKKQLAEADRLSALDYLKLHVDYGKYLGNQIREFIEQNTLDYKVQLIASHGHTVFHQPQNGLTHQLGDGASIAAITGIPVVSDLRSMDVAFGGQGAPLVPIGEKKLFSNRGMFLNIGGIANLSVHADKIIGFDICAANRILNFLAEKEGLQYDDKGAIARSGKINADLLTTLNALDYYGKPHPKSLSNQYGLEIIIPLLLQQHNSTHDLLCTYTEHIAMQIAKSCKPFLNEISETKNSMMVTGGGAYNEYLIERIRYHLPELEIYLPDNTIIEYKEALIMALIGVLRWREEATVIPSVTGATKESIGGAVWSGHL